jgi:hypothetical protein
MAFRIRTDHPLNRFFEACVNRNLVQTAGIDDTRVSRYVASILVNFTHVDSLYRLKTARGKRLEDVGEMLIESNPVLGGASFVHEREVRRHIGDYTLFLAGLFPEYVAALPKRAGRIDAFVDYIKAGKESYQVVASFDQFEFRGEAPLFRRLAEGFELCVFGLNLVKQDIERAQRGWYREVQNALILS